MAEPYLQQEMDLFIMGNFGIYCIMFGFHTMKHVFFAPRCAQYYLPSLILLFEVALNRYPAAKFLKSVNHRENGNLNIIEFTIIKGHKRGVFR
jgi:hypothetical protein